MNNKTDNNQLISALADGELQGDELAAALDAALAQPDGRARWQAYHLIGDVLRSPDLAATRPADDLLAGLRAQLAQEAPLHAVAARREAANDADFRWKVAAGFASFAAVAAIGWNFGLGGSVPATGQLATAPAAPATAVVGGDPGQMIRDPHLDKLLAAHRQFGGATALQNPAGFLRNATLEGPAR